MVIAYRRVLNIGFLKVTEMLLLLVSHWLMCLTVTLLQTMSTWSQWMAILILRFGI